VTMIPFAKMHGCGNDFVVLREVDLAGATPRPGDEPAWRVDPAELTRAVCDRRFGLGGDGALVYGLRPPHEGVPHLRMYYWNADGSRAEMCGNGARCVVRLAFERGETGPECVLETDAGLRPARMRTVPHGATWVEIDMQRAVWEPDAIPVQANAPVVLVPMQVGSHWLDVTAVSMGNPHAVVFVADRDTLEHLELGAVGKALSELAAFPHGANASFVAAQTEDLHLRTWERGAGATLACGTATCAAFAAARRAGKVAGNRARVHQRGGTVEVWESDSGHLWMAGPAVLVAEGTLAPELVPLH
jgi:diaminopimelate epimerase